MADSTIWDTGIVGPPGPTGPQGPAGPSLELQSTPTYIQWRVSGEVTWLNLVALSVITGPQGPQGVQGQKGETGAQGIQGIQGPQGIPGTDGDSSVIFSDTGAPLDEDGSTGDYYIDLGTGDFYGPKAGGVWGAPVSNIIGPEGPQGIQGPAGVSNSQWFAAAGVPAGGLGNDNDMYLDANTGDVYQKQAGTWVLIVNITGPQGPQGIQGEQGIQGDPGADGSVWHSGTGAPAGGLGVVTDWYLDNANGDVYEKTGASTWTLRDNLTGPQGDPGTGLTDGDKGDIIVSASGSVWELDADTVGPTELVDTAVTPGSYTNTDLTVDAQGRITAAANGTSGSGSGVNNGYLLENVTIAVSRSAGAETYSLKTLAGTDPSPSDPVIVGFINATGGYTVITHTSALSFTISAGSTFGLVNNLEAKVGLVFLNNAGALALGAVGRPSGIKDNSIVSTTAEGGTGTADSPRIIYSAAALSNVRARIIGYETYTLAAVGTWDTAPSDSMLTRSGIMEVQVKELLYEKTLSAAGNFDTNEWWPGGTLPSGYDKLEIDGVFRGADTSARVCLCYFNGDSTAANYRYSEVQGVSTVGVFVGDDARAFTCPGSDGLADTFTHTRGLCLLPNLGIHKQINTLYDRRDSATALVNGNNIMVWENTAAINRIQLVTNGASTNFVAGSKVQIYGLKSESVLL